MKSAYKRFKDIAEQHNDTTKFKSPEVYYPEDVFMVWVMAQCDGSLSGWIKRTFTVPFGKDKDYMEKGTLARENRKHELVDQAMAFLLQARIQGFD